LQTCGGLFNPRRAGGRIDRDLLETVHCLQVPQLAILALPRSIPKALMEAAAAEDMQKRPL